ncbi:MAG TPA: rhomboid family intramembrane serine protease, partial [Catalimonadaceae bacterium]|nr:rhomboid family intramembrane serine protease [Catalimonadaceae bacterium]
MVTLLIIGLNVIVSLFGWNSPEAIEKNSFNPYRILKYNEWTRFITSGFFHADSGHLFFNMFSLFFFGRAVESY